MIERCFIKTGSTPPMCGVHDVHLAQRQISSEGLEVASEYFAFGFCVVSGQVPDDSPTQPLVA
jgi:hypothetical protein